MTTSTPLRVSPTGERVVAVTGADRLAFLDDTTTQSVRDAAPGTSTAALVLDANGLPLLHLEVVVLDDLVLLVLPDAESVATALRVLAGRTFLADARFAARDEDAVLLVHGDGAAGAVDRAIAPVAAGRAVHVDGVVVADARSGARRILGDAAAVDRVVAALVVDGAAEGGPADLDAWRVAVGVPTWGREVAAPHLPEEVGLLPTHVHLAKGCYPGQEAVARMWMLGRPRRRLARVRLEGPVGAGWTSGAGRDEVRVTAVAPGQDLGLAFVPGDAAVGARFAAADGAGAVEVLALPGDDAVPPGHDPRMRRRRDRPRGDAAG